MALAIALAAVRVIKPGPIFLCSHLKVVKFEICDTKNIIEIKTNTVNILKYLFIYKWHIAQIKIAITG